MFSSRMSYKYCILDLSLYMAHTGDRIWFIPYSEMYVLSYLLLFTKILLNYVLL